MKSTAVVLQTQNLTKHFPVKRGLLGRTQGYVHAVDGVSISIAAGETLGVVGESGCGKSTLGRLALRLIEPSAGHVFFSGQDLASLNTHQLRAQRQAMQIIFQDPFSSLNPRMTVGQTLREPLQLHGLHKGREDERVAELLHIVGLAAEHAGRYAHEFSGGQRQRIGIARALAVEPQLIVCDEAVSALDVSVQAQVVNLLQDLQAQFGVAYLFIAHDLAVVKHIAHRVAVMYLGRVVELADSATLFSQPRHPYTQALLRAIPRPTPPADADNKNRSDRKILAGDVPSPLNPPSGCHFHTRCPHVQERCRTEAPTLQDTGHQTVACHFWQSLPAYADTMVAAIDTPQAQRLQALQAAFRPTAQEAR